MSFDGNTPGTTTAPHAADRKTGHPCRGVYHHAMRDPRDWRNLELS